MSLLRVIWFYHLSSNVDVNMSFLDQMFWGAACRFPSFHLSPSFWAETVWCQSPSAGRFGFRLLPKWGPHFNAKQLLPQIRHAKTTALHSGTTQVCSPILQIIHTTNNGNIIDKGDSNIYRYKTTCINEWMNHTQTHKTNKHTHTYIYTHVYNIYILHIYRKFKAKGGTNRRMHLTCGHLCCPDATTLSMDKVPFGS